MKRNVAIAITVSAFLVPLSLWAQQTPATMPFSGDALLQVRASPHPVVEESSASVSGPALPFDKDPAGTSAIDRLAATNPVRDPLRVMSPAAAFDRRHS